MAGGGGNQSCFTAVSQRGIDLGEALQESLQRLGLGWEVASHLHRTLAQATRYQSLGPRTVWPLHLAKGQRELLVEAVMDPA
jgi:hypothetical protein